MLELCEEDNSFAYFVNVNISYYIDKSAVLFMFMLLPQLG